MCVNWLRLGDYQKAYRETLNFTMTGFFWDHVLKACTCGQLGRIEEGQACVQTLLALKPDFAQRGRKLIRRYIKFEDIVKQVVEGLNAVGIAVR